MTKKIYNKAGSIHYVNNAPIINGRVIINNSTRNYERNTLPKRERVECEPYDPKKIPRKIRDKQSSLDDYFPVCPNPYSEDYFPEHRHNHCTKQRPYGMLTPVVRGLQEMDREFRARFTDELTYYTLKWLLIGGAATAFASISVGMYEIIEKTQQNFPNIEMLLKNH